MAIDWNSVWIGEPRLAVPDLVEGHGDDHAPRAL